MACNYLIPFIRFEMYYLFHFNNSIHTPNAHGLFNCKFNTCLLFLRMLLLSALLAAIPSCLAVTSLAFLSKRVGKEFNKRLVYRNLLNEEQHMSGLAYLGQLSLFSLSLSGLGCSRREMTRRDRIR